MPLLLLTVCGHEWLATLCDIVTMYDWQSFSNRAGDTGEGGGGKNMAWSEYLIGGIFLSPDHPSSLLLVVLFS